MFYNGQHTNNLGLILFQPLFQGFYFKNFDLSTIQLEHLDIDGNILQTTYFKVLDFIEQFDSNFNSNSLFEIFSIKDFLVDFLLCLYISFIPFLSLKFCSSRLILVNSQSKVFLLLFVFLFYSQYFYHTDQIHYPLLQACIHKSKDQLFILKHYIQFLLQMMFLLFLLLFIVYHQTHQAH